MNTPLCEVIGCGQAAAYIRVAEGNGLIEDYLCTFCFKALQQWYPWRAEYYVPCSDWTVLFADEQRLNEPEMASC